MTLRSIPRAVEARDHAPDEGPVPRIPVQPDRRRAASPTVQDALAAIAERHDLLVYSDEIYDRLAYGDYRHRAFSALPGMRERTILMGGFSKAYAMTGWRVGYVAAPAGSSRAMVKVHQYGIMSAPTVAQDAALAALRDGRARRRADAGGIRPTPPTARRWAERARSGHVRAARRVLCLPADQLDRTDGRDVRGAAADGGTRRRRPRWRVRSLRRGPCPDVLRDLVRAARGGACGGSAGSSSDSAPERPYARLRPVDVTAQATTDSSATERYEAVIGIEIHCQLRTASKMFCACSTATTDLRPNTHVCPVCLGLPGALPVINKRAVELVLTTGLAIDASTPGCDPLGPQELLLPGPAEGLPDQPVRPAAGRRRAPDLRDLVRPVPDRHHPGAPRGGHGQAHPRDRRRRRARSASSTSIGRACR